jgi:acyl-coenzyme A thioesterase PaaI-like protein
VVDFMAEPLAEHGVCFVCGGANPHGLGLRWYEQRQADGGLLVFTEFSFNEYQQGPPHHAHGGATAAVLDEVMGVVAWRSGLKVVLASFKLDYHRPVPLFVPLRAEGWVAAQDERKASTKGRLLLPDGNTAVSASGLYIQAPHLFTQDFYQQAREESHDATP